MQLELSHELLEPLVEQRRSLRCRVWRKRVEVFKGVLSCVVLEYVSERLHVTSEAHTLTDLRRNAQRQGRLVLHLDESARTYAFRLEYLGRRVSLRANLPSYSLFKLHADADQACALRG